MRERDQLLLAVVKSISHENWYLDRRLQRARDTDKSS